MVLNFSKLETQIPNVVDEVAAQLAQVAAGKGDTLEAGVLKALANRKLIASRKMLVRQILLRLSFGYPLGVVSAFRQSLCNLIHYYLV